LALVEVTHLAAQDLQILEITVLQASQILALVEAAAVQIGHLQEKAAAAAVLALILKH